MDWNPIWGSGEIPGTQEQTVEVLENIVDSGTWGNVIKLDKYPIVPTTTDPVLLNHKLGRQCKEWAQIVLFIKVIVSS